MSVNRSRAVPKRERKVAILNLLDKTDLALPPAAIFTNLKMAGATFSERTVHRLLSEMVEEGYVTRVQAREGYYRITNAGREWIESDT